MTEDKGILKINEIDDALRLLPGWAREGNFLKKDFYFKDFKEVNTFIAHLSFSILKLNHHPDFSFLGRDKKMSVKLTTHSTGCITEADLNFAKFLNEWCGSRKPGFG